MARFVNEFSPQTGIGQGMNNAVASLFSGKTPKDAALEAAHMEAYRAAAEHSRAGASKLQAEADAERAGTNARGNFLENALNLLGPERAAGARSYLSTGDTPREAFTDPGDVGPSGAQDAPWFTPTARRDLDTTSQLARLLMAAKPSNIDQLAKAQTELAGGVDRAGVLNGSVDPTRFTTSIGKPVVNLKDGYLYNQVDPNADPTELAIASALVDQRQAQGNKYESDALLSDERVNTERARQKTEGARQGNLNARAKAAGNGAQKLVQVEDADGNVLWMPADEANGEKVGRVSTQKPAVKKPLNTSQTKQIDGTIGEREDELNAKLDTQTRTRVKSRATQLATDPQSEFYQDPTGAVGAAFDEVGELDVSGKWNPFQANTATAKNKGAVTKAVPSALPKGGVAVKPDKNGVKPVAGTPLDAPAAAQAGKGTVLTPGSDASIRQNEADYARANAKAERLGKDAKLYQEAIDAIDRGADIRAVNQRLLDMGYSGEPLK